MMKVFLNDRIISFSGHWPSEVKPEEHCIVCSSPAQIKTSYRQFESDTSFPYLFIRYSTPEEKELMVNKFISLFTIVEAAGGVVRNDYGEILFIHRLGYWDLPKGKINKRDRNTSSPSPLLLKEKGTGVEVPSYARVAALREVREETGLTDVTISGEMPCTWHIYHQGGKRKLKRTYWYAMSADVLQELTPQAEEDITEVKWISPSEFDEIREKCYASLRDLF